MIRQPRNCDCFASNCVDAFKAFRVQSRQLGSRRNVPAKLTPSRKDHIRRLEKISPDASLISKQLMNRAENRISTAHDYVMSFWNAERYKQKSTEDGSPPPRPPRVGPNMDSRWWFWNVAFALLPAVLLTLWAELYGKPKMKATYIKAEVEKRKLIFGPDYVPREGEIRYPEDNDPIFDRLQRALHDLSLWFLGVNLVSMRAEPITPPAGTVREDEQEKIPIFLALPSKQRQSQPTDNSAAQHQPTVEARRQPTPPIVHESQQPTVLSEPRLPPIAESGEHIIQEPQQRPLVEESEKSVQEEAVDSNDWRWNELFSRITKIENRLAQQEQRQQNMHDFQWHRLNQSNIQNRSEDQLIKHWESQRQTREPQSVSETQPFWTKQSNPPVSNVGHQSAEDVDKDVDTSLYNKWKAVMWRGLKHNLNARKEAVEKYGVDIMDRARGFWTGVDSEEKSDGNPQQEVTSKVVTDPSDRSPSQAEENSTEPPSITSPSPATNSVESSEAPSESSISASSPKLTITSLAVPATKSDKASKETTYPPASGLGLWQWMSGRRT